MINYAKILLAHEKDNPSKFLRGTYIISNAGDLIKCYGRMLRFPDDAHIYEKEMQLALGDVIIQCRLIEEENNFEHTTVDRTRWDSIDGCIVTMLYYTAQITDHLQRGPTKTIHFDKGDERTGRETIERLLDTIGELCNFMDWNVDEIEHLGFLHTMERYEQFEQDGWK